MATIHSLPPETIIAILEHLTWRGRIDQHPRGDLYSAALVSRSWHQLAVGVLNRSITVTYDADGQLLLKTSYFGKLQTAEMRLVGGEKLGGTVGAETTREILAKVKGLRNLALYMYEGSLGRWLDIQMLMTPNLRELTSLILRDVCINHGTGASTFPFSLKTLVIDDCYITSSTPYSIFASRRMESFRLVDPYGTVMKRDEEDMTKAFEIMASQLVELHYDVEVLPALIPIFFSCDRLSILRINCNGETLSSILSLIPTQLNTLDVIAWSNAAESLNTLVDIAEIPCVQNLVELQFSTVRRELMDFDGSRDVLWEWEKKGVRLKFAGE